ncbi:Mitochondrial ribosomal protein L37 [Mactra antiquata]
MASRIISNLIQGRTCSKLLTYSHLRSWHIQSATYAVKKGGSAAPASKKKKFEVETDAKVLVTRLCGGNIYKEGEDPVIGPDEEYPEWLWNLRTSPQAIPLEELDQDDIRYWRRLRKLTMRQNNILRSKKPI